MNKLNLYLSGSIKKGGSDRRSDAHYWAPEHESALRIALQEYDLKLLNPAKTSIRRNDFYANYGCDLYLVSVSDVVVVDLREEKGIGVGAEMMYALSHGIPCVGWAPRNSHYRRDLVPGVFGEDLRDWTHPFAFGLTQGLGESLEDVATLIRKAVSKSLDRRQIPTEEAINYFKSLYPEVRFNDGSVL